MPWKPPKPCAKAGCGALTHGRYCAAHADEGKQEQNRDRDARRGSSAERGYGSIWQAARAAFLRANPLCVECLRRGLIVPATVVDHIIPHRGDMNLFWDLENWQPLCAACHNAWKQRIEKNAESIG